MRMRHLVWMLLLSLLCTRGILAQQPFTYQGMLRTSGIPANGNYDFQFSLWTAASGGSQVGSTLTRTGVNVSNGLFTVELDFGNVWDGNDRFLQVAVRPSGGGAYTTLSPRVRVTRAPYSQLAYTALSVPWSGIVGMPAGFADGVDNDTTYAAGAGLQLTGNVFSIASGGVVTAMLADGAVTSAKLADGAVTSAKLANGAVTTAKIGDGQVTDAKIVSVSWSKVVGAPSGFPPTGSAGGDLSGSYPNPMVAGLRGRAIATTAPSSGQVLKWDGGQWAPADDLRDAFWQASGSNIFYNAGSVGIGTNAPRFRLHVISTAVAPPREGPWPAILGEAPDAGVYGVATDAQPQRWGVVGEARSAGAAGVVGFNEQSGGIGVWGQVGRNWNVVNSGWGVYGLALAENGIGVYGFARDEGRNSALIGVRGHNESPRGTGVLGTVNSTTGATYGVRGQVNSEAFDSAGVFGEATAGWGVFGRSNTGTGVFGWGTATTGLSFGVYGRSDSTSGLGVYGIATASSGTTYGVYGESVSPAGYGVYSVGRFTATGTKSFQIDHPLQPENAFLNHYSAEGPEPYNIYRGTVVLDARGEAWVQLPDYFEAINRDPSYHLTPVGAPMPNLHVAVEVQGNRFKIAGGVPGKKVSWEVKAVRYDRWVQEYGFQTEQPKPREWQGKYLHPELYGQPKELGIHYRPETAAVEVREVLMPPPPPAADFSSLRRRGR